MKGHHWKGYSWKCVGHIIAQDILNHFKTVIGFILIWPNASLQSPSPIVHWCLVANFTPPFKTKNGMK